MDSKILPFFFWQLWAIWSFPCFQLLNVIFGIYCSQSYCFCIKSAVWRLNQVILMTKHFVYAVQCLFVMNVFFYWGWGKNGSWGWKSIKFQVFLFLGLLELYLPRLKIIQLKLVGYKLSIILQCSCKSLVQSTCMYTINIFLFQNYIWTY